MGLDKKTFPFEIDEKTKEQLNNTSIPDENILVLFISFDLVNSTQFKLEEKNEWSTVIVYFYDAIKAMVKKEIQGIEIWKYLGDEMVFYYNISDIEKVYNIPDELFRIQENVINKIRENFDKAKILDIKCTIWLAGITRIKPDKIGTRGLSNGNEVNVHRNIVHMIMDSNNKTMIDFLGPDIDIGFRVAKYSNKRKIALSAEYAYLLYHLSKPTDLSKIDNKLKIVAFKELKGVWDGRAYPIIWYYPNWNDNDNSFDYDEHINNDIIRNVSDKKNIEYLEKVFFEAGQKEYIDKFIEVCKTYNQTAKKVIVVIPEKDAVDFTY